MEQEQLRHEAKRRTDFYKGWRVVIVAGFFQLIFGGLYHTGLSVYFLPLIRTFEVSRTKLSFAFAARSLEGGAEGPLAGYLVDRIGPRIIVFAGVIIGGVGFILLGMTQSYLTFLLVFLGVLAVGFSLPFHGLMATINFWFRRRLGTAMSLAATGSAIGGFLVTPIIAWIVLNHSWRIAAIVSGVTLLVAGLPLAFLVRKPIGDEAASEEGRGGGAPGVQGPGGLARPLMDADGASLTNLYTDFTVKEAVRTRVFWVLALAIGLRLMAQSALSVHFVPMLVSRGIGEGTAAILLSVSAVVRLPAVIVGGLVADKWSRPKASAMAMVLGIAAAGYMTFGPAGLLTGIAFVVLFAGAESCNTVTWALIGQFFGRRNFGSLRGIVTLLQSIMSFLGPLVAGFVYDSTKSYRIAFIAIGVTYSCSGLLYWFMRAPAAPKRAEDTLNAAAQATAER
ncbi:MAG: MFS transporter [Dehalococcoidia bacterium]|nr:MFS transporter [Dehalococcoidia bacterium]